jgi:D-sedoheptulose 7-phosphate isomerase
MMRRQAAGETMRQTFEAAANNMLLACSSDYLARVERAASLIVDAFRQGRKLLVYGNGGSSADAQHICGELVGRFLKERRGLPAIALGSNQAVLTAWGNDYTFDSVFERQVEALGQPGDVAWGISTSGNSPNILLAHRAAKQLGMTTIGMTGLGGGQLASLSDILLPAPIRETPRIQEIHLVTYHTICAAIEDELFGE